MFLTERELTLAVAVVPLASAIVGAWYVDRRNEVRKRIDIKRVAYSNLLASIEDISDFTQKLREEPGGLERAYTSLNHASVMMDLVAPKRIHTKAINAFEIANLDRESPVLEERQKRLLYLNELSTMMRKDLNFESDAIDQKLDEITDQES